jgi:hypothetical protein
MKRERAWTIALAVIAVTAASCGAENNPPAKVYKYYAYVAHPYSIYVSAYTIDSMTGALTAVAGSPFAAGEEWPYFIAVVRIEQ